MEGDWFTANPMLDEMLRLVKATTLLWSFWLTGGFQFPYEECMGV